ncbi:MAG: Hpt domain-containing protein [Planctomycetota bacterium]
MQSVQQAPGRPAQAGCCGFAASYLRFCAQHLGELEESILAHDLDSVIRIAERLSGNAGHLGLNELSSLGRQLGDYCAGANWAAIDETFGAIEETLLCLCESKPRQVRAVFEEPGEPIRLQIEHTG